MNLKKLLLTENECYRAGRTITPKGIMVHSTGAENPNLRRYVGPDDGLLGVNEHGNHWNQPRPEGRQVCVHAFIGLLKDGTVATYQTLPWHWRGWHCGGEGNNTHISFEICESALDDGAYFAKAYQEAVEFTAYLCKLYRLDPLTDGVVICHSEGAERGIASDHADVMHWFPRHGKDMDDFRLDVAELIEGGKEVTEKDVRKIVEAALAEHKQPVWNTLEEVPDWGRPTVKKLLDSGALVGTEAGLGITYDLLRMLVINDRLELYER